MQQKRLTDFFTQTKTPANRFHEFIYDPIQGHCYFADTPPSSGASLVTTTSNIRLWYILPQIDGDGDRHEDASTTAEQFQFATNITPLLKSHLQKAIRRVNDSAAIRTAYTMCVTSPADILRRLPVIAIEDVTLVEGTAVIVWLMIALPKRQMTVRDVRLVLAYTQRLVDTRATFKHDQSKRSEKHVISHKTIVDACKGNVDGCVTMTELLALYYRIQYGGMPGDMKMLSAALSTYVAGTQSSSLPAITCGQLSYCSTDPLPELLIPSPHDSDFIPASIDFHCYPWMLRKIAEKTGLTQARIKQLNWFCDSSVNERKEWNKKRASTHSKTDDWKTIQPHLDGCRAFILRKIDECIYDDDTNTVSTS